MARYVIHKWSRAPGTISYSGPTWDNAGIRNLYQETYSDLTRALSLARELSDFNPVGFDVFDLDKSS